MVRNIYFIAFNQYLIWKNTTNYSKSKQTIEAEAGRFLYFDWNCESLTMKTLDIVTCHLCCLTWHTIVSKYDLIHP